MKLMPVKQILFFLILTLPVNLPASESGTDRLGGLARERSVALMTFYRGKSEGSYQYDKELLYYTKSEADLEQLVPALEQEYSKVDLFDCETFDEVKYQHQIRQYDEILLLQPADDGRFRPQVQECIQKLSRQIDKLQDKFVFVLSGFHAVYKYGTNGDKRTSEYLESMTGWWIEKLQTTLNDAGVNGWNTKHHGHTSWDKTIYGKPWLTPFMEMLRQKIETSNDSNSKPRAETDQILSEVASAQNNADIVTEPEQPALAGVSAPASDDANVVTEPEQPAAFEVTASEVTAYEPTAGSQGKRDHDVNDKRSVAILAHIGLTYPNNPNPDVEASFQSLYFDYELAQLMPELNKSYQKIAFFNCDQLDQINEYDDVMFFVRGDDMLRTPQSHCLQHLSSQVYNLKDKLFIAIANVDKMAHFKNGKLVRSRADVEEKKRKRIDLVDEILNNQGVSDWHRDHYGLAGWDTNHKLFRKDKKPWVTTFMESLNYKYCQQNPQVEICQQSATHDEL